MESAPQSSLKRFSKQPIVPGLIAAVLLYVLYLYLENLFGFFSNYSTVSSKQSPNGEYTITLLHSLSEGGHAPYGGILVLSHKQVKTPEQGYVIYAGYCRDPDYSWVNDKGINIKCPQSEAVDTLAKMAYGIAINFQISAPLNQALKAQPSAAGTPQSGAP